MSLTASLIVLTTLLVIVIIISAKSYDPGHGKAALSRHGSHRKTGSKFRALKSNTRSRLKTGRCRAGQNCQIQRPKPADAKNRRAELGSKRANPSKARNPHARNRYTKDKKRIGKEPETNLRKLMNLKPSMMNSYKPKTNNKKKSGNRFARRKPIFNKKSLTRRQKNGRRPKKTPLKQNKQKQAVIAKEKKHLEKMPNQKHEKPKDKVPKLKSSQNAQARENMMMNDVASSGSANYVYDPEKKMCKKVAMDNNVDSYDSMDECEDNNEIRTSKVVTGYVYYYMITQDECEIGLPNRDDVKHETLEECEEFRKLFKEKAAVIYKVDKSFKCPYGEIPCIDKRRCVINNQKCDLYADCQDFSDEYKCADYSKLADYQKKILPSAIDRNQRAQKEYVEFNYEFRKPNNE